jgi:hypothetical protein
MLTHSDPHKFFRAGCMPAPSLFRACSGPDGDLG